MRRFCFSKVSTSLLSGRRLISNRSHPLDLYPLKLNYLLRRPWQGDKEISEVFRGLESSSGLTDSISHVKKATTDLPIKVTEILPRLKDGGAFVKFTYPTETSLQGVEGMRISPSKHER